MLSVKVPTLIYFSHCSKQGKISSTTDMGISNIPVLNVNKSFGISISKIGGVRGTIVDLQREREQNLCNCRWLSDLVTCVHHTHSQDIKPVDIM